MSKQSEMEDIYQSFEWLFQEKLEQLDSMARKMFSEMSASAVPQAMYKPFVKTKMFELIHDIAQKEDEAYVKDHNQLRRGKAKHQRVDENL